MQTDSIYNKLHPEIRKNAFKKWYLKNKEKEKLRHKNYINTQTGRNSIKKSAIKYAKNNPIRKKAWILAQKIPLQPCIICMSIPTHRHHPDPKKPLEVIMLCPLHHVAAHKKKIHI